MNIRSSIKRIPFAKNVYRNVINWGRNLSNKKVLKQLEIYHQGIQIKEALISLQLKLPQSDQDWIDKIEVERKRLLTLNQPLDDGSLSKAGLYDAGMSIQEACLASKPEKPALLLFLLTRNLKPINVIELGTNVGISSSYIGAALKLNGDNGHITSLDASPYRQRQAKEVHLNIGIDNISYVEGLFNATLHSALKGLGPINLAFIDGHHQLQPTLDYFEEIIKYSAPDAVFIFDDIRWSDGMKEAWSRIQSDNRLGLIVDLSSVGICTTLQQEKSNRFVSDPIKVF